MVLQGEKAKMDNLDFLEDLEKMDPQEGKGSLDHRATKVGQALQVTLVFQA